mgnify:CR=1 FL=1
MPCLRGLTAARRTPQVGGPGGRAGWAGRSARRGRKAQPCCSLLHAWRPQGLSTAPSAFCPPSLPLRLWSPSRAGNNRGGTGAARDSGRGGHARPAGGSVSACAAAQQRRTPAARMFCTGEGASPQRTWLRDAPATLHTSHKPCLLEPCLPLSACLLACLPPASDRSCLPACA